MTRLTRSALALCISAMLAGCSSTPQAPRDTTIQAEVCCTHYSQFPWIDLQDKETLSFRIDGSSPVGQFPDGKSYFAAFRLPERADKVRIHLDSWMEKGTVFAPRILALDEQFRVVSETDQRGFKYRAADAFRKTSYNLELELQASKTPYLIIYSPDAYRAGQIQVPHPARVRAEELGEPRPMVTDPIYQHGPFGRLGLTVESLTLRPYRAKPVANTPATATSQPPVTPPLATPPNGMLKETEAYYNRLIREAVAKNDIRRALQLADEAKRAGSPSAEDLLVELLKQK